MKADASPTTNAERGGDRDRDAEPDGVALHVLAFRRWPAQRGQRGQGQARMAQRIAHSNQRQRQGSPAQQQHHRVEPARQARHHDERQPEHARHGTDARPPHGDEAGAQAAEDDHRHPECAIRRDGEIEQRGEKRHRHDGRALEAPSAAGGEPTRRSSATSSPANETTAASFIPRPKNMGDSDWSDEGEGDANTEQPVEAIKPPRERMPSGGGGPSETLYVCTIHEIVRRHV